MRAMHKGMHVAYGDSPHNKQAMIKAVYHLSHDMPNMKCLVLSNLEEWL